MPFRLELANDNEANSTAGMSIPFLLSGTGAE